MHRPHRARALALAVIALGATACQDYNFNPVGHCLIPVGSQRFTLSSVSTADVLFVVDDSDSMAQEQDALAVAFDAFITNLTSTNKARSEGGLQPIDFHIAVTTSSIYYNFTAGTVCSNTCGTAAGTPVCCDGATPVKRPRRCTQDPDCTALGAGVGCRLDCDRFHGEFICCDATTKVPPAADLVACGRVGAGCGKLETHADWQGCTANVGQDFWPFPAGDFVSWAASPATAPNPRVLHFDKSIYTASGDTGTNSQGYTSLQLQDWFKQNVHVGTCGSGQEQLLEAGRLAVKKALNGQQRDTRNADGTVAWTLPTATQLPGSSPAGWLHANSKLVVVFVGDEDDCSAPENPSAGVVMQSSEPPGFDACSRDALPSTDATIRNKEFPVSDFASFFTGLGRPVAAGFILPAAQASCNLQSCTTAGLCGTAQAPGTRLLATAKALSAAGVEVVAGSICDPNFGSILNDIANIVKPPETLELPTVPAEGRITILRIITPGSTSARRCGDALAPEGITSLSDAKATGRDWWFVSRNEPGPPAVDPNGLASPTVPYPTKYVYINPNGSCKANPGETYSADYVGVSPPVSSANPNGGCVVVPTTTTSPPDGDSDAVGGALVRSLDCQQKLGGRADDWICYTPAGLTRGTCTCKGSK